VEVAGRSTRAGLARDLDSVKSAEGPSLFRRRWGYFIKAALGLQVMLLVHLTDPSIYLVLVLDFTHLQTHIPVT